MPTLDEWYHYLFSAVLAVTMANRPVYLYLYCARHGDSPVIRNRLPHACVVLFVSIWATELASFVPVGSVTCWVPLLLSRWPNLVTTIIPNLRAGWLHFNWKLTRDKLQARSGSPASWLLRHKFVVTKPFFAFLLFVGAVLSTVFIVVEWFLYSQYNPDVCLSPTGSGVFIAFSFMGMIRLAASVYSLRHANDAYHIWRELYLDFFVWVVSTTSIAVVTFTVSAPSFPLVPVLVAITYEVYTFVLFGKPILWARQFDASPTPLTDKVSLDSVLKTEACRAAFTEYLKSEFAVEAIQFYEAVEKYDALWKQAPKQSSRIGDRTTSASSSNSRYRDESVYIDALSGMDEKWAVARSIYNTFIKEDAVLQVNLSGDVRKVYDDLFANDESVSADVIRIDVKGSKASIDASLFKPAWRELKQVLQSGPFVRFICHPSAQAALIQIGTPAPQNK